MATMEFTSGQEYTERTGLVPVSNKGNGDVLGHIISEMGDHRHMSTRCGYYKNEQLLERMTEHVAVGATKPCGKCAMLKAHDESKALTA